ncbi:unnamed protein product, partial [Medioppia subpectinata]
DGNGKRVIEWKKLYAKNGVIAEELQLSGQPVFGNWTIVAEALGRNTTKSFIVVDNVLPTFNVEVVLPTFVAISSASKVDATIRAFDSNGRPVKGDLTLNVRDYHYNTGKFRLKTTIDGTATISVHLFDDIDLDRPIRASNGVDIKFMAQVRDSLTGKQYNGSNTVMAYNRDVWAELVNKPETYKPGLKYTAIIKVVTQDGKPVADNGPQLTLKYGYSWDGKEWKDKPLVLTPTNGLIKVDLFPPKDGGDVMIIKGEYIYPGHFYQLATTKRAESRSGNYLQVIRADTTDITVGQDVKFIATATEPITRLVCEVMGRGNIVWAKSLDIATDIRAGFEFSIVTTRQMAPTARMMCHYVRPDNQEVVADVLNIAVALVRTPVTVATKPGAMAGVWAEPSVNILGVDVCADDVMNQLKAYVIDPTDSEYFSHVNPGSKTAPEVSDGVVMDDEVVVGREWVAAPPPASQSSQCQSVSYDCSESGVE